MVDNVYLAAVEMVDIDDLLVIEIADVDDIHSVFYKLNEFLLAYRKLNFW